MNLPLSQPSGAHRAALVLHALADADREWVMAALATEQRGRLELLLRELRQLGVPAEAELLDEAVAAAGSASEGGPRDALEALDDEGFAALAVLLAAEPPRLVSALVAARPPGWSARLLAKLPPAPAATVRTQRAASAPALEAALRLQLAACLPAGQAVRAPSAWSRTTRWLRLRRQP
jgi:hypothetical protein